MPVYAKFYLRGIFTPKPSIFASKLRKNAMFFVSIYQGFLGVARKNAGLSNYEFQSNNCRNPLFKPNLIFELFEEKSEISKTTPQTA